MREPTTSTVCSSLATSENSPPTLTCPAARKSRPTRHRRSWQRLSIVTPHFSCQPTPSPHRCRLALCKLLLSHGGACSLLGKEWPSVPVPPMLVHGRPSFCSNEDFEKGQHIHDDLCTNPIEHRRCQDKRGCS